MKFLKNLALAVLALGVSTAVASASMRCDEHAKKASTTKASSGCGMKSAKVSTVSTATTECTTAEKQACSTAKTASMKKAKNSSCCSSKAKEVKTASIEATPVATEANTVQASVQPVTPHK